MFRNVAEELRIFESIHHPNIINHFGVEIHREEMLIFMEYCPEGTLESLFTSTENGLEESMVRRYTRQLVEAVTCLHEHGVVHRDIKGANIFLTEDMKTIKLGDFGSAVKIKAHTTMPGELQGFVGTQAYMAPEVFTRNMTEGHGRAADIWSMACVVLEMVQGERPWADLQSNYQIMFKVGDSPFVIALLCILFLRLGWASHQVCRTISQKRGRTSWEHVLCRTHRREQQLRICSVTTLSR